MSWHVLVVKLLCVLVQMFPAWVYSWSCHTSWDSVCGFCSAADKLQASQGTVEEGLQDSGLKRNPQGLLHTFEALK